MEVIVLVYDKRTSNNVNTRTRVVKNEEEAKTWVKSLKNRRTNWFVINVNGNIKRISCI